MSVGTTPPLSNALPYGAVLFVDDEEAVVQATARALRKAQFTVITATSATQALRILAERPVDVIVSR